jgi:outer membrane protein OmpA-like peptidoglycan-associated protein
MRVRASGARAAAGRRFGVAVPVLVAVLGLALVTAAQATANRHTIEENLTDRSRHALADAGLSTVDVRFTGRDGRLHAHTRAEADRALAIVRGLSGVRAADAQVDPEPVAPAPGQPPTVTIELVGGQLTISGSVPDAARAALVSAAGSVFGAAHVTDKLTGDPAVTDAGLAGLAGVLTAFGSQTTDARAQLTGGTLTISGTVSGQATKDAVLTAAATAVGAGHVVDQLTVKAVQQQLVEIPPVTFLTGSATLTPAGREALVRAAAVLQANPDVRVRIEGNTDSTGTAAANLRLSQARAQTVLETLVGLGVARDRMSAVGYGESRPKVPDNSPANQAINRRVDFIVLR